MQNKGFVKVFAVLLTLVCMFYLSFSFVTRHYNSKAAEYAGGDPVKRVLIGLVIYSEGMVGLYAQGVP